MILGASGAAGGVDFATSNLYDVLGDLGYQDNISMCWDLRAVPDCLPGDSTVVDLAGVTSTYNLGSIAEIDGGIYSPDSYLKNASEGHLLVYSTTQTAWMKAMANDGANFTLMVVYQVTAATAGEDYLCGTHAVAAGANGFHIRSDHVSFMRTEMQAYDAADVGVLESNGPGVNFTRSTWSYLWLSFKELGGTVSFWNINGSNKSAFDGVFDNGATNNADYALTFFGAGDGGAAMTANSRLSQVAIWDTNLDTTAASAIFDALDPTFSFGV